jgi:hypothetical protein
LLIVNKVESGKDLEIVRRELGEAATDPITIRYDEAVKESDRNATSLLDDCPDSVAVNDIRKIMETMAALVPKRE